MLTCKETATLISRSMDSRLSLRQRWAVRFHIFFCKYRTRYRDQILFLERTLQQHSHKLEEEGDASPSLSDEARRRIREHLIPPQGEAPRD